MILIIAQYKFNKCYCNCIFSFEERPFRGKLLWTEDITVEIKLRFQIPLEQRGRSLSTVFFFFFFFKYYK